MCFPSWFMFMQQHSCNLGMLYLSQSALRVCTYDPSAHIFCRSAANRLAFSIVSLTFMNDIIGFLCRKLEILPFITLRTITECSVVRGLNNWLFLSKKQRNYFDYAVNISVFFYIISQTVCLRTWCSFWPCTMNYLHINYQLDALIIIYL